MGITVKWLVANDLGIRWGRGSKIQWSALGYSFSLSADLANASSVKKTIPSLTSQASDCNDFP